MNDRQKIDCASPADRDTLIVILARNGYTVRHGREKRGASKQYTYFVEFWREGSQCSSSQDQAFLWASCMTSWR